jgi:hypothetical protein
MKKGKLQERWEEKALYKETSMMRRQVIEPEVPRNNQDWKYRFG